jgi:hypothetical protein
MPIAAAARNWSTGRRLPISNAAITEQTFGSRVETLTAEINATFNGAAQVNAGGNATPYTFEACSALIGL